MVRVQKKLYVCNEMLNAHRENLYAYDLDLNA